MMYFYPYDYRYQPYQPYTAFPNDLGNQSIYYERQNVIRGQATWTDGGNLTQCGIPWSTNAYMTVAVGGNAPYQCGETLKVSNPSYPGSREVIVTIVDKVPGYPNNKINLHRRAFQALGADLNQGVIQVEFEPSPSLEQEKWGKYLLEVLQVAYPNAEITDYRFVERSQPTGNQTKEIYQFVLQTGAGQREIQGTVVYNRATEQIIAFDFKELN